MPRFLSRPISQGILPPRSLQTQLNLLDNPRPEVLLPAHGSTVLLSIVCLSNGGEFARIIGDLGQPLLERTGAARVVRMPRKATSNKDFRVLYALFPRLMVGFRRIAQQRRLQPVVICLAHFSRKTLINWGVMSLVSTSFAV